MGKRVIACSIQGESQNDIKIYRIKANFNFLNTVTWTGGICRMSDIHYFGDSLFLIGSYKNADSDPTFNLRSEKYKLVTQCPANYVLNPNDYLCYPVCNSLPFGKIYYCSKYEDNICIKCEKSPIYKCLNSRIQETIQFCVNFLTMEIIDDRKAFNQELGTISASFNNDAIFIKYKILLTLINLKGENSTKIKYDYYEIKGSNLVIYNVKILSKEQFEMIYVDLKYLNIVNSFGIKLSNPQFKIRINNDTNKYQNSSLGSIANKIFSFYKDNKYY